MTFNQITYFLAIVGKSNFSHAADEVFISQSSLSKQIKALEIELGVCLFSRDNYKIELTEAGKAFLPFAEKSSKDYLDIMSNLSSFKYMPENTIIKMGVIPISCYISLINKLVTLESKSIHIDLLEREQSELIKMLDRNEIDFAIVRIDYLPIDKYDFVPLAMEEIGVLCSITHRLASKKKLSLKDIKNESFILLNNTSSLNELCIEACKSAGFYPRVNYSSSRHEAVLAMVNNGLGLALLPKSLLDLENSKSLKCIPLDDNIISTIALIRKKNMNINKKIDIFQNIISECFKEYFEENEINRIEDMK